MPEADDETKGLERVGPEQRAVAVRIRQLLKALGLSQDAFAKATEGGFYAGETPLRRNEISVAVNGGQLARSDRWLRGVAYAAGVDVDTAAAYLRGRISIEGVMQRRLAKTIIHGGDLPALELPSPAPDLSPNAGEAMAAFDWTDVDRATYDRVHDALAAAHQAGGRDPVASFWTAEIKRLIRERPDAIPKAVKRQEVDSPDDRDAAEQAAHKAAKKKMK